MRFLIFLILVAACTNAPKSAIPTPAPVPEDTHQESIGVAEKPPRKAPAKPPTVIVVPGPPPKPICPPPAKTDKQQVLQALDCIYQKIEKTKP